MQRQLTVGDRIQLLSMVEDPDTIPVGTTGTIVELYLHSDWMQVDVDWDINRSLMLSIPPDRVELISTISNAT